jgi:hypothetical protein
MRCVSHAVFFTSLTLLAGQGCGGAQTPDPSAALDRYQKAASAGDSKAIYALLSRDAQRRYGREEVAARFSRDSAELQASRIESLSADGVTAEVRAEVRLVDGRLALLSLEDGRYRVSSAQALPVVSASPTQALSRLRAAVESRDYRALLGLLTSEAQTAAEHERAILLEDLGRPSSLSIEVDGDRARVTLPSGREITLKREDGSWRFDDLR